MYPQLDFDINIPEMRSLLEILDPELTSFSFRRNKKNHMKKRH